MKNVIALLGILFFVGCSEKKKANTAVESEYIPLVYDTVPVDSFSNGAVSVNVSEQIRRSSIAYQDSIRKVKLRLEKERLAMAEKAKQKAEQERIKKAEEENKKKLEAERRQKADTLND